MQAARRKPNFNLVFGQGGRAGRIHGVGSAKPGLHENLAAPAQLYSVAWNSQSEKTSVPAGQFFPRLKKSSGGEEIIETSVFNGRISNAEGEILKIICGRK